MLDVIIFFVSLSILVIIHEFGHFFAAKKVGIKVEEFGLGIPPRAIGKKIGETLWSLNWLPIGGFVRMYGEDPNVAGAAAKKMGDRAFINKKPWQKFIVVIGGVVMNLLLAVLIFSVVYKITGVPMDTGRVEIIGVAPKSPAEAAGLKEGYVVMKVGQVAVFKSSELIAEVAKYKGLVVDLYIEKPITGEKETVKATVRSNPPAGEGALGIAVSNTKTEQIAWWQIYKGVGAGFEEAYHWAGVILSGLKQMVVDVMAGKKPTDVAGPIGMYQATSSIRQNQGMLALLHFFGIISVNLAVMNILPFPALDGGRMVFVIWEWVTGRRPDPIWEGRLHQAGMFILLALIAVVAVGDVLRILGK
jgi:regulator of sigma E protease